MSFRLYPVQPNLMPRVGCRVRVNGLNVPAEAVFYAEENCIIAVRLY